MSKTSKIQCMECNAFNGMYVKDVKDIKIQFAAIRTVAKGHKLVAEGWTKFEKVCSEVGAGQLPQLLRYLKSIMIPTPTPTPTTLVKQEVKEEEEEQEPMDVGAEDIKKAIIKKPIHISPGRGHTIEYRCCNCDIAPKRSKACMDTHIRSVHTKKALLCSFCAFSTYNSLNRHMKEHN